MNERHEDRLVCLWGKFYTWRRGPKGWGLHRDPAEGQRRELIEHLGKLADAYEAVGS